MSAENVKTIESMYAAFGTEIFQPCSRGWIRKWNGGKRKTSSTQTAIPMSALKPYCRVFSCASPWSGTASRLVPAGVLDAGDTAIGHGHYSGTYKPTGKPVRAQFAHFFTFRDGKIVKFQQYTDTAQFKQAVAD